MAFYTLARSVAAAAAIAVAVQAQATTSSGSAAAQITAVTGCHPHGDIEFCKVGSAEYEVIGTSTVAGASVTTTLSAAPEQYTGCETTSGEIWCSGPNGIRVQIRAEDDHAEDDHDHDEDSHSSDGKNCHTHDDGTEHCEDAKDSTDAKSESKPKQDCHFHAGVEHCVDQGSGESSDDQESSAKCDKVARDYNVSLRVGLIFAMFATSLIGVFLPMLVSSFQRVRAVNLVFVFMSQFGTGVIFSTALVHLFTHATIMFNNKCVTGLTYEATPAAIVMAGVLVTFLLEYAGERYINWKMASEGHVAHAHGHSHSHAHDHDHSNNSTDAAGTPDNGSVTHGHHQHPNNGTHELLSVMVLEGGIIFHSLIIGITLVVAGDSFFGILYAVITFHQFFEGIALGSRIAALPSNSAAEPDTPQVHTDDSLKASPAPGQAGEIKAGVSVLHKIVLGICFSLVTSIGMAIGIGVIHRFNGNDKTTAITLGTLNAFSAGILLWSCLVEMWSHDWLHGGPLSRSGSLRTTIGIFGLLTGAILMSLLGKWV